MLATRSPLRLEVRFVAEGIGERAAMHRGRPLGAGALSYRLLCQLG